MSRRMKSLSLVMITMVSASLCLANETPEGLRSQADTNVKSAGQLVIEAQELLKGDFAPEKGKVALSLYIKAGQLFEQAVKIYSALVPNYASETDVRNSNAAMQNCLRTIQEIKAHL